LPREVRIPGTRIYISRFVFLLIAILLFLVARPFLDDRVNLSTLISLFFTIILISGVYAVCEKRRSFYGIIAFAILAFIFSWLGDLLQSKPFEYLGETFGFLFLLSTLVAILVYLFREKEVTADVIIGSVCGYFLLGLMWAFIYPLLEAAQGGSFLYSGAPPSTPADFTYFSFVTLTTLGYGDMLPVTNEAKSLAMVEAVIGQLYVAIIIARLVGIYIARSQRR
jgi:hypothetical protein